MVIDRKYDCMVIRSYPSLEFERAENKINAINWNSIGPLAAGRTAGQMDAFELDSYQCRSRSCACATSCGAMDIVRGGRRWADCGRASDVIGAAMLAMRPDAVDSIRRFVSLRICCLCPCSWTFSQSSGRGRADRSSMDHLKRKWEWQSR